MVSIYLLKSFAYLSSLTHSIKSISPSKSYLKSLDHVLNYAVRKIFDTFDTDNVLCIRSLVGLCSIRTLYLQSMCRLLLSYFNVSSSLFCLLRRLNFQWLTPLLQEFSITDDCCENISIQRLLNTVLVKQ